MISNDVDELLNAQELTLADLEANRAGKVSQRQVDQVNRVRRRLWTIVLSIAGGTVVITSAMAFYFYSKNHEAGVFILPAAGVVIGVLLLVLFILRLQVPSVANEAVTVVEGAVEAFMGVANGGGYVLWLGGVRYKGVAPKLRRDLMQKGRLIKAYVVPKSTIVVAIAPQSS